MNNLSDCLSCGGRGGYPGAGETDIMVCSRCNGEGLDPSRNDGWFLKVVVDERLKLNQEGLEA